MENKKEEKQRMGKIRIAVVGYGNIGQFAAEAVEAAPDMALAGVVRRDAKPVPGLNAPVTDDIAKLADVQAALICVPSRNAAQTAKKILSQGIHTVDSFDMHASILDVKNELAPVAKRHGAVSIVSAGWDPGSDSVVRALMAVCAPRGITDTNFGPGMSMGHTVAAKAIEGVKEALSMTIPLGTGIHRRMVYVTLEEGAALDTVAAAIKRDDYFAHDETHVTAVPDINAVTDRGHGVHLIRKGVSGKTDNQVFEFTMRVNNPALTAQIMVSCARAAFKQAPGCYTMIELPLIDLLPGERDELIRKYV